MELLPSCHSFNICLHPPELLMLGALKPNLSDNKRNTY